jgi:hypothetical protein
MPASGVQLESLSVGGLPTDAPSLLATEGVSFEARRRRALALSTRAAPSTCIRFDLES